VIDVVHDHGPVYDDRAVHDDRALMNHHVFAVAIRMALAVSVMAAVAMVGKCRGRHREGCCQDGDLLEHVRLLSSVNCYCISRSRRPEVNR
jgi:hypothetical protein